MQADLGQDLPAGQSCPNSANVDDSHQCFGREVIADAAKVQPDTRILTSAYSEEMIAGALNAPKSPGFIREPFRFADLLKTPKNTWSGR